MFSPFGRHASDSDDELLTVTLLQVPLKVWQRAAEHHDELMRELALLALVPTKQALPIRLLQLVDVLRQRDGAVSSGPDADKDAALAAGLDRVDLTYHIQHSQAAGALALRALLEEADDYCRTHLLTLAQPEAEAAFARWYVDQFVQQVAGQPPAPWPGPWD